MELKDKKLERLASALYLITSFFNDQEPLKWKLRTLASEFISLTVSLKERQITTLGTKNIVLEIMEFLSVARNVGLVSTENHDLVREELVKYTDNLDYPVNISDFLKINPPEPKTEKILLKDKSIDKGHLKEFGVVSMKKNSRQSSIIAVLKRKKEIMIKDISLLISGCSEKTIQRELSAMIQAGVLRKVGEKRWSRYSIAGLA